MSYSYLHLRVRMPTFEFIEDSTFRESLESDYAEMQRCFENKAWKSVQVLSGSIVEALLIDYLAATNTPPRSKDPLKMDLAEAILICRSEKALSDRTADLCSVVRSYRNLIHPGRVVRLREDLPSESSARIAVSLIELICEEVAKVRQSAFGLTAEQIVSKVERDSNACAILKHLLEDVSLRQKERIVLEVLPNRYFELIAKQDDPWGDGDYASTARDLRRAFRIVLEAAPDSVKEKSAQQFIRILREDEGDRVIAYGDAFFSPADIFYTSEAQKSIVIEYLLTRMGSVLTDEVLPAIKGLELHLTVDNVSRWVDPVVRSQVASALSERTRSNVRKYLLDSALFTSVEIDEAVLQRLETWAGTFENTGREADAETLRRLIVDWKGRMLPF